METLNTSGLRLIQFKEGLEIAGAVELAKIANKIHSVGSRRYIITENQCKHLHDMQIPYDVIKILP